jgi:hypothetical protein
VWCGGVGRCVAKGFETGLLAGDGGENVQQVAGGPRQPVEPRHHHHVIGLKLVEQPAKLHAVGLGSADMRVAENLSASGLGQLPRLGGNALALAARRYPCVTVFHWDGYAANLRSKKAQSFQCPNFAAKFLCSTMAIDRHEKLKRQQ